MGYDCSAMFVCRAALLITSNTGIMWCCTRFRGGGKPDGSCIIKFVVSPRNSRTPQRVVPGTHTAHRRTAHLPRGLARHPPPHRNCHHRNYTHLAAGHAPTSASVYATSTGPTRGMIPLSAKLARDPVCYVMYLEVRCRLG